MIELLQWTPYFFGFCLWLAIGGWLLDEVLPRYPRLLKFVDKLIGGDD